MHSAVPGNAGTIGVISDTHGLLRPEIKELFAAVDMIVHAGDVGSVEILKALESIAPVTAVSGNMDSGMVAAFLNEAETFEFRSFKFHLIHNLSHLSIDPSAAGIDMVISGHTHLPDMRKENGVMFLNPGSAGPPRHQKPVSLAKLTIRDGGLWVRHYSL